MLRYVRLLCLLPVLAFAQPVAAQGVDLTGAWSWQSPDPTGPIYNTLLINSNGTYVRVGRNSMGQVLRYEGYYRAAWTGQNQLQAQTHVQNWYPASVCSQISSMGIRNCNPMPQPADVTFGITVLSPSSIQIEGMTAYRDPNPVLLNIHVPVQLVNEMQAPPQPVMPTLHPYTTPNGPGLGMAAAGHAATQDFINGYLRGCYKDDAGRLWGCQQ